MQLPKIPVLSGGLTTLAGLAAFIRGRLGEVGDSLAPRLARRGDTPNAITGDPALESARLIVIGAAAPFAATSYARARLLRQMHATGLLSDLSEQETEQVRALLGVAQ
ncbi:MAG TPA: hypothetical protein VFE19_01890 [Jatrophihabitantaceae bacterium]|jgi:hypothetical protein|nr:hypothetical protein [Jatrophihabitantaceae bacterium]